MYNICLASFFNYLSNGISFVVNGGLYIEYFGREAAVAVDRQDRVPDLDFRVE